MPIYEYRCQSCGHELEKLQRLSDAVLSECPACGKAKLRRLISAAGFRLKGAGWYETDFKSGDKRNLAEAPAAKGDSAAQSNGSGADSTPASKPGAETPAAKESSASKTKEKPSSASEAS